MDLEQREHQRLKWQTRAYEACAVVGVCILIGVAIYVGGIVWQAVATVIVTAIMVFLLHGTVNDLEGRGLPRWAGTLICFLVVSAIIAGCVFAFIPTLVSQLSSFASSAPAYASEVQAFFTEHSGIFGDEAQSAVQEVLGSFSAWLRGEAGDIISSMATGVIGSVVGVGNVLVVAFISLVCSFWILMDLPKIAREARSLFDDKYQDDIDIFADAFGNAVYGWAKSTLICAVLTGLLSGIAFFLCGIPYSAVLGFLCGLMYLIPYVGPMVATVIVALVALLVSPVASLISIIVNVVISNVVGSVLSPRLMKRSVNVHPALMLIAILVGGALGGAIGMFLAIPIIGALQGVFVTYYEAHTGKEIATEDGALFQKKATAKLPKIEIDTGKWKIGG